MIPNLVFVVTYRPNVSVSTSAINDAIVNFV